MPALHSAVFVPVFRS